MTGQPNAASARGTTTAIGPNGRTIHFNDLVQNGELVEVEGRPMIVYYDADAPDWFVDELHKRGVVLVTPAGPDSESGSCPATGEGVPVEPRPPRSHAVYRRRAYRWKPSTSKNSGPRKWAVRLLLLGYRRTQWQWLERVWNRAVWRWGL